MPEPRGPRLKFRASCLARPWPLAHGPEPDSAWEKIADYSCSRAASAPIKRDSAPGSTRRRAAAENARRGLRCLPGGGKRMRRLTAVWPILFASCLTLCAPACCWQGYVLHGDWSLGLIHTANPCGQCAADGNCCGQVGCSCQPDGQCQTGCPSQNECPGGNQYASQGAGRNRCALGSRKAKAAATAAVPGPTGPMGHPRFHPVPTRPVFGPLVSQPPVVLPPVTPELADPLGPDLEEVPPPRPATVPNSARRRQAVRRNPVQTASGYQGQWPE